MSITPDEAYFAGVMTAHPMASHRVPVHRNARASRTIETTGRPPATCPAPRSSGSAWQKIWKFCRAMLRERMNKRVQNSPAHQDLFPMQSCTRLLPEKVLMRPHADLRNTVMQERQHVYAVACMPAVTALPSCTLLTPHSRCREQKIFARRHRHRIQTEWLLVDLGDDRRGQQERRNLHLHHILTVRLIEQKHTLKCAFHHPRRSLEGARRRVVKRLAWSEDRRLADYPRPSAHPPPQLSPRTTLSSS